MSVSFHKDVANWVEPIDNRTETRYGALQSKYMVGHMRLSQRADAEVSYFSMAIGVLVTHQL